MKRALLLILAASAPASAAAEQRVLGMYGQWGAFANADSRRCRAVSEPTQPHSGVGRPFADIVYWPDRGVRGQVHFRLSQRKRSGSALLLRIDDQTFQLVGGGADAWGAGRRGDSEIVGAMRRGIEMAVETRAEGGTLVRDIYSLRGAATAIDAAAIGCSKGG